MSTTLLAIGPIGTTELLIILAIVVLVFGVGKLPEIGRQMGQGIKNFKKEMADTKEALSLEEDVQDQTTLVRDPSKKKEEV